MTDTVSTTGTPIVDSIALDDLSHDIELLRIVEDELARLNSLKSTLRGMLKNRLGDVETGTVNGLPVLTWKLTYRVALIPKLVKQLHPEIVHDCEDILPVRTFLLLDTA